MRGRRSREERELLLEAFLGGWQAATGRYVHPRAQGVVEACFDMWLEEAADEVDIFGLAFRRRAGLPQRLAPALRFDLTTGALLEQAEPPKPSPPPPAAPRTAAVVRVPRQRRPHGRNRPGRDTRGGSVTAAAPER